MASLSTISDSELLAHVPVLLTRERAVTAELIEYLAEIERRRLYLEQACASLRSFCIERLGYSEDEASKRVRVARLARALPSVLDELRSGAVVSRSCCRALNCRLGHFRRGRAVPDAPAYTDYRASCRNFAL